jgi:hypothetical protein
VVVIYGSYPSTGTQSGFATDTWIWNGTDWQAGTGPEPAGFLGVAAYDPNIRRIILFAERMAQTWSWNGSQWQPMFPHAEAPGSQGGSSMSYDPTSKTVVMFGGIGPNHEYLGQTWAWNGVGWHQLIPSTNPPGRAYGTLVSSSSTGGVLLVGGENGKILADAWRWDGKTWIAAASLGPRDGAGAIDTGTNVVVFGGAGDKQLTNEVWAWDGAGWSKP